MDKVPSNKTWERAGVGNEKQIEERIVEIEIRVARQEDMIDTLNQTIYRQQKKIDELESLCSALARRIKEIAAGLPDQAPVNEKPPHY